MQKRLIRIFTWNDSKRVMNRGSKSRVSRHQATKLHFRLQTMRVKTLISGLNLERIKEPLIKEEGARKPSIRVIQR